MTAREVWRSLRIASGPLRDSLRGLRTRSIQRTARLSPEDRAGKRRRQHVLVDLVNTHWPDSEVRVAEVGCAGARTSDHVLKYCPQIKEIVAVDLKELEASSLAQRDRVRFVQGWSDESARLFPDESFELVFIDADHSEEWVRRDVAAWLPKVKRGGVIAGHDYGSRNWPGVKRAVDSLFADHPHPIHLEANKVWWTRRA